MPNDQRIDVHKGEEQPSDKDRAQTAHKTDQGKVPPQKPEQDDQPNKNSVLG